MQDLTEMKNNYLQAINLSNKILEADPKNQQALTIKMIWLRKGKFLFNLMHFYIVDLACFIERY